MLKPQTLPPLLRRYASTTPSRTASPRDAAWNFVGIVALVLAITLTAFLSGCGTSGYAGAGITGLSASSVTLDAGQQVGITASLSGSEATPAWSLAGSSCSGSTCGTLSAATGADVTYTAPSGITSQLQVTLTSAITGTTNSKTVSITVNPDPTITGSLPAGTVGTAYSATLTPSGGTGTLTMSLSSGTLPDGLTFDASTGVISGTPTTAGTSSFVVQVVDQSVTPYTATVNESITITSSGTSTTALSLTGGVQPTGTVGTAYSTSLTATGGVTPYTWSIASGTLPAGLAISSSTGVISGTPTAAGTSTFVVQVEDSTGATATASASITINAAAALTVTTNLPAGTVGTTYTGTITATGGTAPYTCAVTSGTLPAGLTLSGCSVTGTPTTAGSSAVTITVTDSSSPAKTGTATTTIVISSAASLTVTSTFPEGTVGTAYTGTVTATGGTAPYTCAVTNGTLPAGLTLSGCSVTGTPTAAGSSTVTVTVTDSSSPAKTGTATATIVISSAANLTVTSSFPAGTVGTAYSGTVTATGGTAPYTCAVTSGTLPAGLTLSGCSVTGTPTAVGSSAVTITVTDSSSPAKTGTATATIVISSAASLTVTSSFPAGTVGTAYTGTVTATGGTAPYTCAVTSGTLPAGLALSGCSVTGTPTTAGSSAITVTVTDSSSPAKTGTATATIVISSAASLTVTSSFPAGTVGTSYTGTVTATGGTAPYTCSVTTGTLPAGLTLSGCSVTGTPTTAGSSAVTITVTDSSSPAKTGTATATIVISSAGTLTVTTSFPTGTVGTAYTGTITATGGTAPYTCAITGGTLPAGLSLSGCSVTGTPTTPVTSSVIVTVTDSSSPAKTGTATATITIGAAPLSLSATLPNAIVNTAYSYTLQATGGTGPYTYAVTAGTLPAGITLASNGVLSGTPTATGASSFTVTVTDSTSATATDNLILLVTYQSSPYDTELTGPYAYLFQGYDDVVAGVLAYQTAAVGSFTSNGAGVLSAGELDANHQSSTASTGNTVTTQTFVGTYIVNSNSTGFITITTLNADGTTDQTSTYAISLKAPVSPATVATEGSLIEYDDNELVGTKGSGTLLQQTTSTFSAGLNGSYAFGLQGDTPCLVSCTLGILSGPVVSVGQFTTDGSGSLTSGEADTNIASTNYPTASLTGSYETADQNGRLALSLTNSAISSGVYPTDYAVYVVNADEAFVMSTDVHSSFVLLAGTAQLQDSTSFDNTALSGPFIGYENAQTNPGLLGVTLQSVLDFSSATIFRADGDGAGNCNTTNVDTTGLTGLIDSLTGLANGNTLLEALLGDSSTTGTATCQVTSNGRAELNYPAPSSLISTLLGLLGLPTGAPDPRIVYLTSPGTGYFLESSYAGLGHIEQQTGAPFSLATLDGTYVDSTIPASSLASITTSGYFTADGAGNATSTLYANVGVGTLNVLQLTTSTPTTYALNDPNANSTTPAATAGRYLLGDGSTVIYAISPDRFVLLNTSVLATSPSVSLRDCAATRHTRKLKQRESVG
ncbi:beta strand repeat-containing protein [Silvibacterium sp.]|uniref:beta strand repeat-containing protein n=1 Tax=Silvibacterium sp. TaxID=1964179 RepID=UPI0039E520F7